MEPYAVAQAVEGRGGERRAGLVRRVQHFEHGAHLRLELREVKQVALKLAHVRLQAIQQGNAGECRREQDVQRLGHRNDQA